MGASSLWMYTRICGKSMPQGRQADDVVDVAVRQDRRDRVELMLRRKLDQIVGIAPGIDDQAIRRRFVRADDVAVRLEIPENQAIDLHC